MSNFFNAANVDFNQLFEPDPSGPTVPGFYQADGVTLLRYAALANGSKIPNVLHYHPDGYDVTNVWAGAGTVTYTVPSLPDIGTLDSPVSDAPTVDWHPARALSRMVLIIKRNGTMELWQYTRNFVATVVRNRAGGLGYLYPDGRLLGTWNWAQTPRADFGDNYTLDVQQESIESGRWWIPGNHSQMAWQPGIYGSFNIQQGVLTGTGTGMPINVDRPIDMTQDMSSLTNNSGQRDPEGALRRYTRGQILVTIRRNGNAVLQFRFRYNVVSTFCDIDVVTYEGGSGPPGGGGDTGGGGGPGTGIGDQTEIQ